MRRGLIGGVAAAALVVTVALRTRDGDGTLRVRDVRLPQPVAGGSTAVVYATIVNGTGTADTLRSAHSSIGTTTSLMQEVVQGGAGHMSDLTSVGVPAHTTVRLSPGGRHLMIAMSPAVGPLAVGTRVTVTFSFAHAGDVVTHTTVTGR